MDGVSPGLAVSSKSRPLVVVDVTSTQGLFQVVIVLLLRDPNITIDREQCSKKRKS